MADLAETRKACEGKVRKFQRMTRAFNPNDIEPSAVAKNADKWTQQIYEALDDLVDSIETMSIEHGHTLGSHEVANWKNIITNSEAQFKTLASDMERRSQLHNQVSGSFAAAAPSPDQDGSNYQKAKAAEVDVEVDADVIFSEGTLLSSEINKYADWGEATDHEIETAMNRIDMWRRKFDQIKEKGWAIQRNTRIFDLNDQIMRSSMGLVNTLGAELDLAIENVEFEDETRCLYSTNKSKAANVKLPMFGGGPEEDFCKFEKEVMKGFVTNRVRRDDQVRKLRECLKNHPRTMIPSSLENIDEAWKVLKTIYGDASRMMKAKKSKLASLDRMPRNGSNAGQLKTQIEWLIKMELILQDIFEIGGQSLNMERAAYSPELIDTINSLFHFEVQKDFAKFDANDSKEKLSSILAYIVEMRGERQIMLSSVDAVEVAVDDDVGDSDDDGGDSGDDLSGSGSGTPSEDYLEDPEYEVDSDEISDLDDDGGGVDRDGDGGQFQIEPGGLVQDA